MATPKENKMNYDRKCGKRSHINKTLEKIYQLIAVHGEMKREDGTWCHYIKVNDKNVCAWKDSDYNVQIIRGGLFVSWDYSGVVGCTLSRGKEEKVYELYENLQNLDKIISNGSNDK